MGDVVLGLYEIRHVHTTGGMGLVYRVRHRGWNTELALKRPRPERLGDETAKKLFEREAETWVQLGLHPNVVTCYYVRRIDDVPCAFAEYVTAGTLASWIHRGRLYEGGPTVSLARVLDVSIQVARGLAFAHDHGLVHQDVKPGNVLLTPRGTVKVTDFGLARAQAAAESEPPADVAQAPGPLVSFGGMTPAYCSPEQFRRESLVPAPTSWSWGVLCWKCSAAG